MKLELEDPANVTAGELQRVLRYACKRREGATEVVRFAIIQGGTTNVIFRCDLDDGTQVLVRVYGEGSEALIDREREDICFEAVARVGLGPKLLGKFDNGRVEDFIVSRPLTPNDLRRAAISRLVARRMKALHMFPVPVYPSRSEGGQQEPLPLVQLREWSSLASFSLGVAYQGWNITAVTSEARALAAKLKDAPNMEVFGHNDVNHLNLLLREGTEENGGLEKDDSLVVIDWEYAGLSTRGYDVGNYFCEWASDLSGPRPQELDWNRCPTHSEQEHFCREYLAYPDRGRQDVSEAEISALIHEAQDWGLASHMLWGLWGLIQSNVSSIGFSYVEYATNRLSRYYALVGRELPNKNDTPILHE